MNEKTYVCFCLCNHASVLWKQNSKRNLLFTRNKEDLRRRRRESRVVDNKEEKNETNFGVVTDNLVSV